MTASPSQPHTYTFAFCVRVPSGEAAQILRQALSVDQPISRTTRRITTSRCELQVDILAETVRALRTAVHAVLEQLTLQLRTFERFGHTMAPPSPALRPRLESRVPPL